MWYGECKSEAMGWYNCAANYVVQELERGGFVPAVCVVETKSTWSLQEALD